jgi:hypothetical protein
MVLKGGAVEKCLHATAKTKDPTGLEIKYGGSCVDR